ncbi:acyltransferase family protein [Lichenibacterium dinghuense]|uniref:acyltransferase family protein n=1 Tax=Lichenibacterium dinghuense TaxID=2895977 RepID=UPI001F21CEDA|nr:acyltransferase [Lichenibacterium sp. 6Y81]
MTAAPPPVRPSPLVSLQVLRAAAALMVLLHHAGHEADLRATDGAFGLDRFFDLGFGVHLFFVISGFIMLLTARGFGSGRGALVFMARRVVRVVPLYWLLTSATLLVAAASPHLLNGASGGAAWVAGSYLFIPVARGDGTLNPVLGQGWTLDYEMFFYVLFALAMVLPRRAALPALALALVALVALGRLVAPPFAAAAVWTDGLLLEFLLGLGVGLAAERGVHLRPRAAAAVVGAGVGAAVALGPWTGRFDALGPALREGVPAALIVAGCVLGPRWRGASAVAALALIGDASYSLYLSHPFAVRLLGVAWTAAIPAGAPPVLFLASACAAAVLGALALHRFVERPMTEALQRRSLAGRVVRPILPDSAAGAARRN